MYDVEKPLIGAKQYHPFIRASLARRLRIPAEASMRVDNMTDQRQRAVDDGRG